MWICWAQLLPERNPAWFFLRMGSTSFLILFKSILLYTLAAIDNREIHLQMVIRLRSPFLSRGTMTPVIHWPGGDRFEYTSAQKQWIASAFASLPSCRASAVIAQSSRAALLVFIWRMASNVSSSVGGGLWIGKSWADGCGRSDGIWPLSSLRRELKYSCHSTRRSLSLLRGVPSLILTLILEFRSFPDRSWIILQVVV